MDAPTGRRVSMADAEAAAPAVLVTLLGVLVLGFMSTPVRPYAEGRWAAADIFGLIVLGFAVGFFSRSFWGLIGTILGATAAVAIQLYVLTEQASWSPAVATGLREPGWSGVVLGALVTQVLLLAGAYVVGSAAGGFVRPSPVTSRPPVAGSSPDVASPARADRSRLALWTVGALVAATVSFFLLLRFAAGSAYVPREDGPLLLVSVEGDRILAAVPETLAAGRTMIDTNRLGTGTPSSSVYLDGPLDEQGLATVQSGFRAIGAQSEQLLPYADSVARHARQLDLPPGTYAIVVAAPPSELAPEAPVRNLDARTITVSGPEAGRPAGGGPVILLGFLLALAIAGWSTAATALVTRLIPNPIYAWVAGLVAAAILWLVANGAIDQSHNPF